LSITCPGLSKHNNDELYDDDDMYSDDDDAVGGGGAATAGPSGALEATGLQLPACEAAGHVLRRGVSNTPGVVPAATPGPSGVSTSAVTSAAAAEEEGDEMNPGAAPMMRQSKSDEAGMCDEEALEVYQAMHDCSDAGLELAEHFLASVRSDLAAKAITPEEREKLIAAMIESGVTLAGQRLRDVRR